MGLCDAVEGKWQFDRKRIARALAAFGLPTEPSEKTASMRRLLEGRYKEQIPLKYLGKCNLCAGVSDVRTDECPYCGGTSAVELTEEEFRGGVAMSDMTVVAGGKLATNGVNGHAKPATAKDEKLVHTVADLDKAVLEVQRLKGRAAVSGYQLGKQIALIKDTGLYKLRTVPGENGRPKGRWASFDAFCNEELGMTPGNANLLIRVAETFTENDVNRWGTTKLALVLKAPTGAKSTLLEKVKAGATTQEVAAASERLKEEKRVRGGRPAGSAKARAKAKAGAAEGKEAKSAKKPKPLKMITVASVLGHRKVPLYKKPVRFPKSLDDLKKLERANKISDVPYGMVEFANGVYMHFSVMETAGGELELRWAVQRDEE